MSHLRDIEGDGEYPRVVLSMRVKVSLAGLCFVLMIGLIAFSHVPHVAQALRGPGQDEPRQEDAPPEETQLDINTTIFFEDLDTLPLDIGPGTRFSDSSGGLDVGDHCSTQDGCLFLNTTESGGNRYWGVECDERYRGGFVAFRGISPLVVGGVGLQMRLRFSDDNGLESDRGGGTRIWGLSDQYVPILSFACYSPGNPNPGLWANAQSAAWRSKYVDARESIDIDITEWHTYTVLWEPGKGTMMVDGRVIVSTDSPPDVPMGIWLFIENLRLHGPELQFNLDPIDLELNESMQIDYVRVFVSSERFEEMDSEVSSLFSHAAELIGDLGQRGVDTTNLSAECARAQDDWREGHYFYLEAKPVLERIVGAMQHWDEVASLFADSDEAVKMLEQQGNRQALMLKADYGRAQAAWAKYDYETTSMYLQKILDKAAEVPEPTPMLLLSLLGLIVVQAHLRPIRGD